MTTASPATRARAPLWRVRFRGASGDRAAFLVLFALAAVTAAVFAGFLSQPLWFDEQGRAYQIALPVLHLGVGDSYAPLAVGWVLVEKAFIHLLGTTEVVLRLPELISWLLLGPVCYAVARELMPRFVAFLVAAALVCNPATVHYGTQLKSYIVEALATLLILWVWARAREANGWRHRLSWYAIVVVIGLFSVPAPFVVGPLFALDLVEAVRVRHAGLRELAARAVGPLVAGAALLAYFVAFVVPQSFDGSYPSWQRFFAPHDPARLWHFLSVEAPTYLAGAVTGLPEFDTVAIRFPDLSSLLTGAIDVSVLLLVIVGIWALRRHVLGRGVIVAALGGLVLQLVASLDHRWPFGLTRADLFYAPLVYLLAGAGAGSLWRNAGRGRPRRLAAAVLLVATVGVVAVAEAQNLRDLRGLLRQVSSVKWMQNARAAVAAARREYRPGTLAYVWLDAQGGFGGHGKGWTFYMDDYDWSGVTRLEPRVPLTDTYFASALPSVSKVDAELSGYLARHPGTSRLLIAGTSTMAAVLASAGFHLTWERLYPRTCLLMVWVR